MNTRLMDVKIKLSIIFLLTAVFFIYFEPYYISTFFLLLSLVFSILHSIENKAYSITKWKAFFLLIMVFMHVQSGIVELEFEYEEPFSVILKTSLIVLMTIIILGVRLSEDILSFIFNVSSKYLTLLFFLAILSSFIPLASLLGQEYRGGSWIRVGGIYPEPGMLANATIFYFVSIVVSGYKKRSLKSNYFKAIIILLLAFSVFGFISFLLLTLYLSIDKRLLRLRTLTYLVLGFSVSIWFVNNNERGVEIKRLANDFYSYGSVGSYKYTSDGSAWLKISNIECIIKQDLEHKLLGNGIYSNARVTNQYYRLDGRVDYTRGCAFINSNGALVLWVYQYGLITVTLLVLFFSSTLKVDSIPVFILLLSRSGENVVFIALFIMLLSLSCYRVYDAK